MTLDRKEARAASILGRRLLVLLLLPCAAARPAPTPIDGSRSENLPLRGAMLRGPESVAFDGSGAGPYSGVSDGRVLK
jgi:hypothetical protein